MSTYYCEYDFHLRESLTGSWGSRRFPCHTLSSTMLGRILSIPEPMIQHKVDQDRHANGVHTEHD